MRETPTECKTCRLALTFKSILSVNPTIISTFFSVRCCRIGTFFNFGKTTVDQTSVRQQDRVKFEKRIKSQEIYEKKTR